jgi:hypothetical protein
MPCFFGRSDLLPMANQPGVVLNLYEEQQLEAAWRELQLGKSCSRKVTLTQNPAPKRSRPCGG